MKTITILLIVALIMPVHKTHGQSSIAEDYRKMMQSIQTEFEDMMMKMSDAIKHPVTNNAPNTGTSANEIAELESSAEESMDISVYYDDIPIWWPSDDYSEISSPYGYRTDPFTRKRAFHRGIDIPMPENTPVLSTASGIVEKTGYNKVSGRYIVIKHKEHKTIYAHLNRAIVKEGQRVNPGDIIGYSGNTGRSTGPHLHYQISTSCGSTINPINFIQQHQNF